MTLLHSLASTTLIITPLIIILLLLTPLLDRKYAAGGRYLLWILIMAGLCVPFVSFIPRPAIQIDVPLITAIDYRLQPLNMPYSAVFAEPPEPRAVLNSAPIQSTYIDTENLATAVPAVPVISPPPASVKALPALPEIDTPRLILCIWLTGVFLALAFQVFNHLSFRRFAGRWSVPETDSGVMTVFNEECLRMKIRGIIRLERCKGIKTPMLAGFVKPVVILPDTYYSAEDLALIFRHELTHYKRRHLWYKLALAVMKSVYWFNPAVHLMAKQANKDIETVCDMLTVSGMSVDLRKRYSEIILSMASGGPCICRSRLTTYFLGDKNMLRQRFSNILGAAKKSGAALFISIGIVIIGSGFLIGFNFAQNPPEVSGDAKPLAEDATVRIISLNMRLPDSDTMKIAVENNLAQGDLSAQAQNPPEAAGYRDFIVFFRNKPEGETDMRSTLQNGKPGLQSSAIILANDIKGAPENAAATDQYVIGDLRVVPNVKAEYLPGQYIIPYMQVSGMEIDQTTLNPLLEVEFIIRRGNEALEVIPGSENNLDLFYHESHILLVGKIPVSNYLTPGKYQLEIRVLDRISNSLQSTLTDFTVITPYIIPTIEPDTGGYTRIEYGNTVTIRKPAPAYHSAVEFRMVLTAPDNVAGNDGIIQPPSVDDQLAPGEPKTAATYIKPVENELIANAPNQLGFISLGAIDETLILVADKERYKSGSITRLDGDYVVAFDSGIQIKLPGGRDILVYADDIIAGEGPATALYRAKHSWEEVIPGFWLGTPVTD